MANQLRAAFYLLGRNYRTWVALVLLTLFIGAGADLIESEESHLAALAFTCLRARAH